MTDKLIRISTVVAMTGKSRSAIYADMANGCFPKSIHIGARSVAWLESSINAWIKSKIDAANPKPKSRAALMWEEMDKQAKAEYNARSRLAEDI